MKKLGKEALGLVTGQRTSHRLCLPSSSGYYLHVLRNRMGWATNLLVSQEEQCHVIELLDDWVAVSQVYSY